ncbi:VOC family protein [Streptomyces sp. NPDC050145]|uniref:VOC family protein n=1 Tax=Streptomyces sp. NPDC050145 TaxID=3365602 RepID=UPI00378B7179
MGENIWSYPPAGTITNIDAEAKTISVGRSKEQVVYFRCTDPSGAGPRVLFQRAPESKKVKNRVHLDVRAGLELVGDERLSTLEAECARLVALGATHVRTMYADEENESCLVMQDIEGNEFRLA